MDINEQAQKIASAKAELEAKNIAAHEMYNRLVRNVREILEKNICLEHAKVINVSSERAEIQINGSSHSIDLFYYDPWYNEKRKLEMNFGCFGSFDVNDTCAIHYCEVLGHLAGVMKQLEHELVFSEKSKALFDEHRAATDERYKAKCKVETLENELKNYSNELKKNGIIAKIRPGLKIVVRKATAWRDVCIKTVDHVMNKNITFTEDYGRRTSKDVLVDKIIRGEWTIEENA